jgi:hypothetical protein
MSQAIVDQHWVRLPSESALTNQRYDAILCGPVPAGRLAAIGGLRPEPSAK